MAPDAESSDQKAIRLLTRQLEELRTTIRGLSCQHSDFKAWRDTTRGVLERYLGSESHHTTRFRDTRFFGRSVMRSDYPGTRRIPEEYVSRAKAEAFLKGCETTEASLKAAIKHLEDFGVYVEEATPGPAGRGRGRRGGVSQTFHGPVTFHNQAIATDNAIQNIERMGETTVASLKGIAELLQQSEDLTPRQVREGLAGIQALTVEIQKPEAKKNWKSILDCGQSVLAIADKATDLAHKLAPCTTAVVTLVKNAKHLLR
jgi:hypothetical protein